MKNNKSAKKTLKDAVEKKPKRRIKNRQNEATLIPQKHEIALIIKSRD